MNTAEKSMAEYNAIYREENEIYRRCARNLGLSEGTFWILYCLRGSESGMSQSLLCSELGLPKQTVNSALKKMEADGLLFLASAADKRRKEITLTAKGKELSHRTVDEVFALECQAMNELSEAEQKKMLALFRKYNEGLKKNLL
jgi:DNA-binding MarR family transcriptional regulator